MKKILFIFLNFVIFQVYGKIEIKKIDSLSLFETIIRVKGPEEFLLKDKLKFLENKYLYFYKNKTLLKVKLEGIENICEEKAVKSVNKKCFLYKFKTLKKETYSSVVNNTFFSNKNLNIQNVLDINFDEKNIIKFKDLGDQERGHLMFKANIKFENCERYYGNTKVSVLGCSGKSLLGKNTLGVFGVGHGNSFIGISTIEGKNLINSNKLYRSVQVFKTSIGEIVFSEKRFKKPAADDDYQQFVCSNDLKFAALFHEKGLINVNILDREKNATCRAELEKSYRLNLKNNQK